MTIHVYSIVKAILGNQAGVLKFQFLCQIYLSRKSKEAEIP